MPPLEVVLGDVGGAKKEESWLSAMKRVNVVLRARMSSWKGKSGGWVVKVARKGLIKEVRSGGV